MFIQLANIACGLILASPEIAKIDILKNFGHGLHTKTAPYLQRIGIAQFILGLVALFDRADVIRLHNLWSSYPQAIAAMALGLLLASHYFHKYEITRKLVTTMQPYRIYVAIGGIIIGLNSIL